MVETGTIEFKGSEDSGTTENLLYSGQGESNSYTRHNSNSLENMFLECKELKFRGKKIDLLI
jgi:hypothetical protein